MPDCKTCKENRNLVEPVPYIVHEAAMARQERTVKKLLVLLVLLISLLTVTNGFWIWYEMQWEDVSVNQEVDTGNGNAFVEGIGDLNYGEN